MNYLIQLLEDAIQEDNCFICLRTPSQVYANIKGYGKAHRFVWEKVFGPIPEGMFVCHECDTPRCINPHHLFLGTPLDNMQDKVAKGRQHLGGPGTLIHITEYPKIVSMRYAGATYEEIGDKLFVSRRSVARFLESCPHD